MDIHIISKSQKIMHVTKLHDIINCTIKALCAPFIKSYYITSDKLHYVTL